MQHTKKRRGRIGWYSCYQNFNGNLAQRQMYVLKRTIYAFPYLNRFILAETVRGLDEKLKVASEVMRSTDYPTTAINSGYELFVRFITLATLDTKVL